MVLKTVSLPIIIYEIPLHKSPMAEITQFKINKFIQYELLTNVSNTNIYPIYSLSKNISTSLPIRIIKSELFVPAYQTNLSEEKLIFYQPSKNGFTKFETISNNKLSLSPVSDIINLEKTNKVVVTNNVTSSWPTSKKTFTYYIQPFPNAPKSFNNYINTEVWRALYQ